MPKNPQGYTVGYREAAAKLAELKRNAIPIKSVGLECYVLPRGMKLVPVIQVDATDRPDVANLARVHQVEGSGEIQSQWGVLWVNQACTVALQLHFREPVVCDVTLLFPTSPAPALAWLLAADDAEYICLTCEDIPEEGPVTNGVLFQPGDLTLRSIFDELVRLTERRRG